MCRSMDGTEASDKKTCNDLGQSRYHESPRLKPKKSLNQSAVDTEKYDNKPRIANIMSSVCIESGRREEKCFQDPDVYSMR